MNIPLNIFKKAVSVARKSNVIRGKVGAILFTRSGHIIASACNRRYDGNALLTIHAESALIDKATKLRATQRFGQLFVLVVRTKRGVDGIFMAKPCSKCRPKLEKAGFVTFFSDYQGKICQLGVD